MSGEDDAAELKALARRIAHGHAWSKHASDFPELKSPDELAEHLHLVLRRGRRKTLTSDRTAYWDIASNTVVILDRSHPDMGTAFKPARGQAYFNGLL